MYELTDSQISLFLNGELKLSVHKRYKDKMVTFCRNNCIKNKWYTKYVREYIHFYTVAVPVCCMTKSHMRKINKINKQQSIEKLQKKKEEIEKELEGLMGGVK